MPSRLLGPRLAAFVLALATFSACAAPAPAPPTDPAPPEAAPEEPAAAEPAAPDPDPERIPSVTDMVAERDAERAERDERPWTDRMLDSLTLRQKIGQMIMPVVLGDFTPEGTPGHDRIVRFIEEFEVGGVIVSVGSPNDVAVKLNDLQRHAALPLLVAADLETGAGFRLKGAVHSPTNIALGGATDFPSLMALGAADDASLAYEMGRVTAIEARAVGIHVPFAPVLDVNSNPDNPIINTRSFGEDPARVALLGSAFVRGVQEHGGLATGKHFPGHGDTETDSHIGLPTIGSSRARLDAVELLPFREVVSEGIGGIMTAHITVPALNGGSGEPSTLSAPVLTDLLRGEMGFDGLIFTDAMDMGAIDRRYDRGEAAVLAVEAGADVILQPPNVGAALDGILEAVSRGRVTEERIDRSVRRILATKEAMGLHEQRMVPIDSIVSRVGIPEHTEIADDIARRSLTLLRNESGLLPLLGTRTARVLSVTYRRTNDVLAGRWFNARLRSRYPRLTTVDVGRDTGGAIYEGLLRQARASNLVVVSLHVTAVSYAGSVAIPDEATSFIRSLERLAIPHVVVSFGSPYLASDLPGARAFLLAWSGSEASQRAAADALFGDFDITGATPTRIPPLFDIGAGLRLRARTDGGG